MQAIYILLLIGYAIGFCVTVNSLYHYLDSEDRQMVIACGMRILRPCWAPFMFRRNSCLRALFTVPALIWPVLWMPGVIPKLFGLLSDVLRSSFRTVWLGRWLIGIAARFENLFHRPLPSHRGPEDEEVALGLMRNGELEVLAQAEEETGLVLADHGELEVLAEEEAGRGLVSDGESEILQEQEEFA